MLVLLGVAGVFLGASPVAWSADPPAAAAQMGKVNINTATAAQLTALPGVGETIAQAIVEYRDNNGAFRSVEDLLQVKGIGEKKLAALRDLVSL
ncbi:MAG TPA: helix-hairpin-helix domain-containing protein [Deferrisomatales bacterium]|nr:helix-hairpin-helix domain-containing protein [Deferrisomatales bacterium]